MTLSSCTAALQGPDRAVEAEVAVALGWTSATGSFATDPDGNRAWLPRYTASLDAAMTVVPEGARVRIDVMEDGRGGAWVYWPAEMPTGFTDLCATPALALLSAALKARGL